MICITGTGLSMPSTESPHAAFQQLIVPMTGGVPFAGMLLRAGAEKSKIEGEQGPWAAHAHEITCSILPL